MWKSLGREFDLMNYGGKWSVLLQMMENRRRRKAFRLWEICQGVSDDGMACHKLVCFRGGKSERGVIVLLY